MRRWARDHARQLAASGFAFGLAAVVTIAPDHVAIYAGPPIAIGLLLTVLVE